MLYLGEGLVPLPLELRFQVGYLQGDFCSSVDLEEIVKHAECQELDCKFIFHCEVNHKLSLTEPVNPICFMKMDFIFRSGDEPFSATPNWQW